MPPSPSTARPPGVRLAASLAALAALTALSGGCASQPDLTPRPARLVPAGGVAGADATVVIEGTGFLPRASQTASGGPATVETAHTAALDGLPLTDVRWLDAGRLQATIPASLGLGLGPHTLTVVNALGHAGALEAAWTVIEPAGLKLGAAAPAQVVMGQTFTVTVTAANPGSAKLSGVSVKVTPSAPGAVAGDLSPPAFDLLPGADRQLLLTFTASAAGAVSLDLTASGREDFTGRQVTASSTPTLLVQAPAALVLTASAPPQAITGLPFTLAVTATNTGGSALRGVAVAVTPSGAGPVGGDLAAPAFDLLPGATQPLQLALTASAAGAISLGVAARGLEELGDRLVSAAAPAAALAVQAPAALALSATLAPAQASLGQPVTLTVTATNTGGTTLRSVAVVVTPSIAGALTGDLGTPAFDLLPGATEQRQLALVASAAGPVALGVTAGGTEALSDRPVAAAAPDAPLLVQTRAALVAALSLPATLAAGAPFQVTMTVENRGQAAALDVAPDALTPGLRTTAAVSLVAGPSPASAPVAGDGGEATFTWTWQLTGAGLVELRGGAAGQDGNDGGSVVADPTTSNLGGPATEVTSVAADPLGDGTPVAALAVRGDRLYVGPGQDGSRFYRLDPASGAAAVLPVEISVDLGPSPAANTAWRASPPATTFGAAGCRANTTTCGPNNENGRGLLASGPFAGDEWLVYAGAIGRRARSLYLSRQDGGPIPFTSVDLDAQLTTDAVAPTAIAFAPAAAGGADRLYAAFAETRATFSPLLVALATAPQAPWLDAGTGSDAFDLGAPLMPLIGGAAALANRDPQPRIEAMAWFRDRLFVASGSGILAAVAAVPRSYATTAADWRIVTPSSLSWALRRGLPATASADLTPADRAVPAMAAFGTCGTGPCLFLARNVQGSSPAVVPQLWRCDPGRVGAAADCESGDWSLTAPNTTGDQSLTQLGVVTNGAVGVLLATGRFLYLGFDNAAAGVQLYRTAVVPSAIGDFRGQDGCVAGTAGCQGLGGNGLGLGSAVTRLFDAKAVTAGGVTTVYLAAGDATTPLRLFAITE